MLSAFVEKPENDPFRRAQDERVTVEILSAVRYHRQDASIWKKRYADAQVAAPPVIDAGLTLPEQAR